MPISFKCQVCSSGIRVSDELAGRKGKCPKCGNVLIVPELASPSPPAAAAPPPPPVPPPPPPPPPPIPPSVAHHTAPPPLPPMMPAAIVVEAPQPADPFAAIQFNAQPGAARSNNAHAEATSDGPRVIRRRQGAPAWVWLVLIGLIVTIAVGGVAYSLKSPPTQQAAADPAVAPGEDSPAAADPADASPPATAVDVSNLVQNAIVRIEVLDAEQAEDTTPSSGSGFVIHPSGLVATNYHILAQGTKAEAVFNDGKRFPVEGYVAVRPDCDLAIVKLQGAPADLPSLTLSKKLAQPQAVVFSIDHPVDHQFTIAEGTVAGLVGTAELPASSATLKDVLASKAQVQWIKYNAPMPAETSGGPVVNGKGEVLGINAVVDKEAHIAFAIEANYLDQVRRRLSPVTPLARFRRRDQSTASAGASGKPTVDGTSDAPGLQVKDLITQLSAKGWQPENEADYELFRQLAVAFGRTQQQGKQMPPATEAPADLKQIEEQVGEVAESMKQMSWKLDKNIPGINRLAGEDLAKKGTGLFLFGEFKFPATDNEGRKGVVLEVAGTKQEIFVPHTMADDVPEETYFLILGTSLGSGMVGDNQVLQAQMPRIASSVLFEIAPF